MSTVVLHPKMSVAAIAELIAERDLIVEKVGDQIHAHARNDDAFEPIFLCQACRWTGTEPLYVDTVDHFNPPRGDIPRCPCCGSFSLIFHIPGAKP